MWRTRYHHEPEYQFLAIGLDNVLITVLKGLLYLCWYRHYQAVGWLSGDYHHYPLIIYQKLQNPHQTHDLSA